jgi:hypothetical protein
MNSIQERSGPLLQALGPAQMPASYTLGREAWIPLIGSPGNMQVSGSKGPEQLAVEVAEALWRRGSDLSSLAADWIQERSKKGGISDKNGAAVT